MHATLINNILDGMVNSKFRDDKNNTIYTKYFVSLEEKKVCKTKIPLNSTFYILPMGAVS